MIIRSKFRRTRFLICSFLLVSALLSTPAKAEHRDPAPIPDEIISRIVDQQRGTLDPLVQSLSRHLDEAADLLRQVEENTTGDDTVISTKLMLLNAKSNELGVLRTELRSRFASTRERLKSLGLTEQVAAWDELLVKAEERFRRVGRLLEDVRTAPDKYGREKAVVKARQEMHDLHGKIKEQEQQLGDSPLPTWTFENRPFQQPDYDHAIPPVFLMSQPRSLNNIYAFNGNTLLAPLPDPVPGEALSCGYTAADLGENSEVKLTSEIKTLAQQLGFSPARIFEYVANEIRFEPYYGSLKGATGTLVTKAGNATDQTSLLIALLRASNIPARYVKGTTNFVNETRLLRWLGVKTQTAAANVLAAGGIPTNFNSGTGTVQFTHVWAEACVPYAHYRGAKFDNAGHRWIPLDPSVKDKSYQAGIVTNVAFDYNTYLATRSNTLPFEAYEQQVETAIKGLDANNTLEDVPYKGVLLQKRVDILPASPPYEVINFQTWGSGINTSDTAEVPDSHRAKFVVNAMNSAGTILATTTLSFPETALARTTLSYKGATPTDQTALDVWKADGNLDSAIPCTINVVPVIKSEGVDKAAGSTAVGLCTIDNQLALTVSVTELTNPTLNTITYKNIGAANYHALQAYAFQTSDQFLSERVRLLLDKVKSTVDPISNLDETEGEFLNLVGLKYMRYISDASKRIGSLKGSSGENGNHLGLTCARTKVQYLFDLPFAVIRIGFLVDMPGLRSRDRDISTGKPIWETFQLSGYTGSAYESYIWQESSRLDAVSTVRGIQFARETGIEVMTLTSSNWAANSSKFTSNVDSSLNYNPTQVSSIYSSYISQGYTLTIPRSLIQYQTWKGAVFVAEKNNFAIDGSMRSTYAINQYAGGFTVSTPVSYDYNSGTDTGYVQPSTGTTTTAAPLSVGNGTIGNGSTIYNTTSGDPVNMVTGNVYHTERDISIKGRGGLPLVFERSYNSRNPQDGPLGFGWTHSFNHYLTFKDDNYNGTADAPDIDSVTSSVSWTDGTGSEKFIQVSGNASGVPIGSVFTPPKGFFFQVTRNGDGTYAIEEKNGLTYTFENVAGTINQKAQLVSIRDRNNNTLTLAYPAGKVTITDGLGRVLTLTYTGSRVSEVSDWTNRKHQYGYDGNGNLTSYKNPLALAGKQNPVSYDYYTAVDGININHALKKYTLPRGNGMTFEYYSNGRAFRHYNTQNETNTFTYNDFRRETVQVNERGFTRRFFFNEYGNPEKIVEENGAKREYVYDTTNPYNRTFKKDPEGYLTGYQYDANGNVTQITNPSGATVLFSDFNTFNQPGKAKDARGNYTLFKYDTTGNLLQDIKLKSGLGASIDPAAYIPQAADIVAWTVNSYDAYGNPLTSRRVRDFAAQIANPAALTGPALEYGYTDTVNNVQGLNLVTITRRGDKDGDGTIAVSEYDTAGLVYDNLGRVKNGITADWYPTAFVYDDVDRAVSGTDSLGNQRDYEYDPNGNPAAERLVVSYNEQPTLLDSSSAGFDLSDRKVASINAGGFVTAYQYDTAGNVVKITNPDNYTLAFDYDANNRVIKAYDEDGNNVTKTLDLSGKPRKITDPNGNIVSYDYYDSTKDGRLKKVTQPKIQSYGTGRAMQYDYDANGNVTSVTDIPADGSASRTTMTTFDELNRPTRIVGPQYSDSSYGAIRPLTKYTYDTLGNLTQVQAGRTDSSGTNPASDIVATQMVYKHDDFGRKLKETDPLGKYRTFEYDVNNNIKTVTDAKSQVTGYTWGYGHQMLTRTNTAGNTTYTRNTLGQVITAKTPDVTYTYTYDEAHRLESVTDSRGNKTLSYDYSPGGLLNAVSDSDDNVTDYLYDKVGRLSSIWAANYDTVSFSYDPGGRLTEKWFPNGITARYSYNADNTLQQVVNRTSASTIISQHDYTYDGVGNRLTHAENVAGSTTSYGYLYDELNRLTQVGNGTAAQQENYGYDPLNNRTTKQVNAATPVITAIVYDAANQLKEIRQDSTTGPLLANMLYDDNGNMTSKTEGATTTTLTYNALNRLAQVDKTGISTQTYSYDDQGRRIKKTVDGTTTNYLYNGPDIYGEYVSWTTPTALYTHGPNTDDPIIRATATAAQYYHQDGLGSVVALSNTTGGTDGTQRFDAWGNKLAGTGAIPQYGYTGREPDETGLTYYRARYYDPTIGRFTQRDPIGMQAGINSYLYLNGNPVNFTDPTGLEARDPQAINTMLAENTYVSSASDASTGLIYSGFQNLPSSIKSDTVGLEDPLLGPVDIAAFAKLGVGLAAGTIKLVGNEIAGSATKVGLEAYEVGTYKTLQTLSSVGDDLALHHVGQSHVMGQTVVGFTKQGGAAIALPTAEHLAIPTIKGVFDGSARSLLANDIKNLRSFTNAPNGSLQQLIELNKNLFPGSFTK